MRQIKEFACSQKRVAYTTKKPALLTIGSIFKVNNQIFVVRHTNLCLNNVNYFNSRKYYNNTIDITLGYSGFVSKLHTDTQIRYNWSNLTTEQILHIENLDKL